LQQKKGNATKSDSNGRDARQKQLLCIAHHSEQKEKRLLQEI